MSREIKFRAYDPSHGSFITYILVDGELGWNKRFWGDGFKGLKPWQQFTGLKDKNGADIYEGDIVRIDWNDIRFPVHTAKREIYWDEDDANWRFPEGGSPRIDAKYHYEVIGNIHQNPELLS